MLGKNPFETPTHARNRSAYNPNLLVLRSSIGAFFIDQNWENVEALLESGWYEHDPPKGAKPPTQMPVVKWDINYDGPVEPHPEYVKALHKANSVEPSKPSYMPKNYKGSLDPLLAPDVPPLLPHMKSVRDIKPKDERTAKDREAVFRKYNA